MSNITVNKSGLSNLIAKEITYRRKSQDSKFSQERNKLRSHILENNFSIPKNSANKFYIYSNNFGNVFTLNKRELSRTFDAPVQMKQKIEKQICLKMNESVYKLWQRCRYQTSSNERIITAKNSEFSFHYQWINVSFILLVSLLIVSFLTSFILEDQTLVSYSTIKQNIISIILAILFIIFLVSIILLYKTYRKQYVPMEYDKEVIKVLCDILKIYEPQLNAYGYDIKADKEMTTICFIRKHINATNNCHYLLNKRAKVQTEINQTNYYYEDEVAKKDEKQMKEEVQKEDELQLNNQSEALSQSLKSNLFRNSQVEMIQVQINNPCNDQKVVIKRT